MPGASEKASDRPFPVFGWAFAYKPAWLRGDLLAGLTVWAVLVPESLAYASIAGVSPVVGLYAAPAALLFYAALGSSRHLVVGPTSASAALSAAAVGGIVAGDAGAFAALTATLAIAVGMLSIAAGLARLGFLANFISEPVLKGFIIGLALTIIAGQLPKIFGVEGGGEDFFEKIWEFLKHIDETDGRTLVIGVVSLVIVLGLKATRPALPGSLFAVLFGILMVSLFDLDAHGVAIVGEIDGGLPSFGFPDVESGAYRDLAAPAAGVMLIGFVEGLAAAKTYAAKAHYDIDSNQELIGVGAANIASGLAGGMVVGGSLSKTAVNGGAGARSQLSGLVTAVLTIITLLFLMALFENLPEATLGAVVIAAVIELVDVRSLVRLFGVYTSELGRAYGFAARPDFIAALAALFGVLVFDTLPGLFIGIAVSILLLLYRASRPQVPELGLVPGTTQWADVARHPENAQEPGVAVLRVESGIFFANAEAVRERIRSAAANRGVHAIVLDAETVSFIDVSGAHMINELTEELHASGIRLVIARDIGQVRDVFDKAEPKTGSRRLYGSVSEAVAAVRIAASPEQP